MKKRNNFVVIIMVLALGLAGSILFFPFNFNNRFTCLYHRLFVDDQATLKTNMHNHEMRTSGTLEDRVYTEDKRQDPITGAMHSEFVNRYVRSFGLMWWLSLALLALGLYSLRRQRIARKKAQSF